MGAIVDLVIDNLTKLNTQYQYLDRVIANVDNNLKDVGSVSKDVAEMKQALQESSNNIASVMGQLDALKEFRIAMTQVTSTIQANQHDLEQQITDRTQTIIDQTDDTNRKIDKTLQIVKDTELPIMAIQNDMRPVVKLAKMFSKPLIVIISLTAFFAILKELYDLLEWIFGWGKTT